MGQGLGLESYIQLAKQSAYKTAETPTVAIGFLTENFAFTHNVLFSQNIHVNRYSKNGNNFSGLKTNAGNITGEVDPVAAGYFAHMCMGITSGTEVASGTVYSHQLQFRNDPYATDCALTPYTLEIYRGVDSANLITDCLCNQLQFSMDTANGIMQMNAGMLGRVNSVYAPNTPSYLENNAQFIFDACSISIGGAANANLTNWTLDINNNVAGKSTQNLTKEYSRFVRQGFRVVNFGGTLEFNSQAEFNKFSAKSSQAIDVNLVGATTINSGRYPEFRIVIPEFVYTAFPVGVGGTGEITVAFTGEAVYHTASATELSIFIQNSLSTY